MAQPLADRIRAALGPKSRLADVRAVLADTRAEFTRLDDQRSDANRRRIDPSTSHDEAAAANAEVQECGWQVDRLQAAIGDLTDRIASIEADESYQRRRDEFAAAREARDKLAARLKERVPAIFEELRDFVDLCEADVRLIGQMNQSRPHGEPALLTAEHVARGVAPGLRGHNLAGVIPLADLQLIDFFDGGYMWSRAEFKQRQLASQAETRHREQLARTREARRSGEEAAAERAREAARWKRMAIRNPDGATRGEVETRDGLCGAPHNNWYIVEMEYGQIVKARDRGVLVEEWGISTHATAEVHPALKRRDVDSVRAARSNDRRPREAQFS
jgi:hypothetical protein